MIKPVPLFVCTLVAAMGRIDGALAHHSIITFDTAKQEQIDGFVTSWTFSNPHSYLELMASDSRGGAVQYRCETLSTAALVRMRIDAHTFSPGDHVQITAAPSRVDDRLCLLEAVSLDDGKRISFLPGAASTPAATLNASIYGTWSHATSLDGSPGPAPPGGAPANGGFRFRALPISALDHETLAGRKADAAYHPIQDDPVYHCSPVGPLRLWHEPDTDLVIRREGDRIMLHYQFMDAQRVIFLVPQNPSTLKPGLLGYSLGHFEGDTLVVQTTKFAPGVIMQYALDAQGRLHGVLHSDAYTLSERIRFDAASHQLEVQYTQHDPKYYRSDLPGGSVRFNTSADATFEPFNCQPTSPPAPASR